MSARVIVHSPAHAKAALAAAAALQKPVILLSAPGAGAMTGPWLTGEWVGGCHRNG